MARSWAESLKDIAVMEEAVQRMKVVLYAKGYFENRFKNALKRVVDDLGEVGATVQLLLRGDDPEFLIRALRLQVEYRRSGKQELFETLSEDLNSASESRYVGCTGVPRTCRRRSEKAGPLCNRCLKV